MPSIFRRRLHALASLGIVILGVLPGLLLFPRSAPAYPIRDWAEVYGYFQMWLSAYEQMEDAKGVFQHPSGDEASASTTGFSVQRARIGAEISILSGKLAFATQLKLEGDPGFLDLYVRFRPWPWLALQAGQFKIPGPYENLEDNRELDFLQRTRISNALADYSLSRTTYASSLFYGNRAYLRDLGVALLADIPIRGASLRAFFMVGNGLGSNLFIGGGSQKEFLLTNPPQFFYGLRLEVEPLRGWLTLGGHFDYNRHDNVLFNSGRAVYDLYRMSCSGDLGVRVPPAGLRLHGMYGAGWILDDFLGTGRADYQYAGWEVRAVWQLKPLLLRSFPAVAWLHRHLFEVGLRFESYATEADESGVQVVQRELTVGLSWLYRSYVKLQANYILRRSSDPTQPDLDDDALLVGLQGAL